MSRLYKLTISLFLTILTNTALASSFYFYQGDGEVVYPLENHFVEVYEKDLLIEESDDRRMRLLSNLLFDDGGKKSFGIIIDSLGGGTANILNFDEEKIGNGYCTISKNYRICHIEKIDVWGQQVEETCQMHHKNHTIDCMGSVSDEIDILYYWHDHVDLISAMHD